MPGGAFAGRTAVLAGGATLIGRATAAAFVAAGGNVVIADIDAEGGTAAVNALGAGALFVATDVTRTAEVDALMQRTVDELGGVHAVFNNAGIGGLCPAQDYTDEDFLRVIDINLNGVFRVARAALRHMYRQGSGNIVNCASILGMMGQSQTAAYTAAKGGVVNLTRTLAIEAASHGVRVNGVGPGYIDTPLLKDLPPDLREALIRLHPLGRLGTDVEVANAVVFLASDEASFITGTTLMVDGGFTAGKS